MTTQTAAPLPRRAALVVHQFRFDLLAFARNGQARFFTLALPTAFLLIFATIFRSKTVPVPGGLIHTSVYYVPGIIALGVIQAAVSNLALSVTTQREAGVLKRRRATPVTASALIAGRALTAAAVSLAMAAVLAAIGWFGYGAHIPAGHIAAFAATVLAGAVSFGCLGFAISTLIRGSDSAQPVIAAITLPLYSSRGSSCHPPCCRAGCCGWRGSSRFVTSSTPCSPPTTRSPPDPGSPEPTC